MYIAANAEDRRGEETGFTYDHPEKNDFDFRAFRGLGLSRLDLRAEIKSVEDCKQVIRLLQASTGCFPSSNKGRPAKKADYRLKPEQFLDPEDSDMQLHIDVQPVTREDFESATFGPDEQAFTRDDLARLLSELYRDACSGVASCEAIAMRFGILTEMRNLLG